MFDEVFGHERVRDALGRALRAARLPPALLLSGPEGVGKKTLALALARGLLCESGPGEPCGRCRNCGRLRRAVEALPDLVGAASGSRDDPTRLNLRLHPDVMLVEPWRTATRTEIKIAQVRDLVGEAAGRPFEARARAFILNEAHAMNEEAANALLKVLEEPPATSHLFLVTSSPQALLPTVRSRCQMLRLGPLPIAALEAYLEASGLDGSEARLRAALAGGSVGKALAFASEEYRALRDDLLGLLEGVGRGGGHLLEGAERLADNDDAALALTALRSLLRDASALRLGADPASLLNADVAERIAPLARGRVGERAPQIAEAAARARAALRGNANRLLTMDLLVDSLA